FIANRSLACHLFHQIKEILFSFRINAPVCRDTLIAFTEGFSFSSIIKETPRSMGFHRTNHVVVRLFKVIVVVFIENDRLRLVPFHLFSLLYHLGYPCWIIHPIPMEQQIVRGSHYVGLGDAATSIACTD